MPHPNQYPRKTFVPYEGTVDTVDAGFTIGPESREGIAGISPEERLAEFGMPVEPLKNSEGSIFGFRVVPTGPPRTYRTPFTAEQLGIQE